MSAAQELDSIDGGEIEDAEVIIQKERLIELPTASKVIERVRKIPEIEKPDIHPHKAQTFDYNPRIEIPEFDIVPPEQLTKEENYNHLIKLGFGNYVSPLLKARFSVPGDKNKSAGLDLDHLSFARGAKDGKNSASSESAARVYANLSGKKVLLNSSLNYGVTRDYFYGYSSEVEVDRDTIRHEYNHLRVSTRIQNASDGTADYEFGIDFRATSDNFNASENLVSLTGNVDINEQLFLETVFDYANYKDDFSVNRNHFQLKGFYRFEPLNKLQLNAGLTFSTQNDQSPELSNSQIFPFLAGNYDLSENYSINAMLSGGYQFNSYSSLVDQNRFLGANVPVANSEHNINSLIALKGSPSETFSFDLFYAYNALDNFLMLNNDFLTDSIRFTTVYESGRTKITKIGGTFFYRFNTDHEFGFNGSLINYKMDSFQEVIHLPNVDISFTGRHRLIEGMWLNWSFKSLSGIKSFNQSSTEQISLPSINELNLGLDYQFSDKVFGWMDIHNLINQEYQRYQNYPNRGLQVKVGLIFRL